MQVEPFALERMQSTWEHLVEINLAESGVHPMRVEELIGGQADLDQVLHQPLGYTQSNGTVALREAVASMYPGASADHIEITNGGSEANFLGCWLLLEPGDEVVLMVPTYMQTWGLARAFAGPVHEWALREAVDAGRPRWKPDLDSLERLVTSRTKLIVICNPNNPTGACFDEKDLDAICAIAARHGAWMLCDEIYRGAELHREETPSIWGRYDRALITSGLSKAYGLPGLRIGWIVGPPDLVARCWAYHDYISICPAALSDRLAGIALSPDRRDGILARTRGILNRNYPIVAGWLDDHAETFTHVPPEAGAIVYVKYSYPVNSTALVNRLREEKSVLIVPGDHFGMDGYLRIGFGAEPRSLREGLARFDDLLSRQTT